MIDLVTSLDDLFSQAEENLAKISENFMSIGEKNDQIKKNVLETKLGSSDLYIQYDGKYKVVNLNEKKVEAKTLPKEPVPVQIKNAEEVNSVKKVETSGPKWFDLPATEITPEIKQDLLVVKNRDILDPKRHYKKGQLYKKGLPKFFQVGTIIEGAAEFYSSRMTKRERKQRIVDEILGDESTRPYLKRKFNEIQQKKLSGGKKRYQEKLRQRYKN